VATVPIPPNYGIHDTFVRDGLAFVSAWNSGLRIYDVGNGIKGGSPANPQLVSTIVTASVGVPGGTQVHNAWWFHNPNGQKRYLFVGQEGPGVVGLSASGDLHVVDVSDLNNPVEVASLRITGAGVHNLWMDEANAVLYAAWYNAGVVAIDVSGTLTGNLASRVIGQAYPGGQGQAFTWGVMLSGGTLYASDMLNGFFALDPTTLAIRNPTPNVTARYTSDLWVHGTVGYSGTWGSRTDVGNAIHVWNVASGTPVAAHTVFLAGVGTVSDLAVTPNGAVLVATTEGGSGNGLHLLRLTDPLRPEVFSHVAVSQGLHTGEVAVINGRTYVFAARNPGSPALLIYDITGVD